MSIYCRFFRLFVFVVLWWSGQLFSDNCLGDISMWFCEVVDHFKVCWFSVHKNHKHHEDYRDELLVSFGLVVRGNSLQRVVVCPVECLAVKRSLCVSVLDQVVLMLLLVCIWCRSLISKTLKLFSPSLNMLLMQKKIGQIQKQYSCFSVFKAYKLVMKVITRNSYIG